MRQHDGLGMTAPELVSELNSFVIHSRHPELVSGSPEKWEQRNPGDADLRQHDGLGVRQYSQLTTHHSQFTTHNSQLTPSSTKYNIDS